MYTADEASQWFTFITSAGNLGNGRVWVCSRGTSATLRDPEMSSKLKKATLGRPSLSPTWFVPELLLALRQTFFYSLATVRHRT